MVGILSVILHSMHYNHKLFEVFGSIYVILKLLDILAIANHHVSLFKSLESNLHILVDVLILFLTNILILWYLI